MMKWKSIDESYLDYLRNTEKRVPKSNYGANKYKPFFGELFFVGDLIYVTQVSSPKEKHEKLKNNLDFKKLYSSGQLIAVVNLNYMFPVPEKYIADVDYDNIEKYRSFASEKEKNDYIYLLKTEIKIINGKFKY